MARDAQSFPNNTFEKLTRDQGGHSGRINIALRAKEKMCIFDVRLNCRLKTTRYIDHLFSQ